MEWTERKFDVKCIKGKIIWNEQKRKNNYMKWTDKENYVKWTDKENYVKRTDKKKYVKLGGTLVGM